MTALSDGDRAQLAARGITVAEAERQLAILRQPPQPFRVVRPATVGDGIHRLDAAAQARAQASWGVAVAEGGAAKMVPASGAASRMFAGLRSMLDEDPFPAPPVIARRAAAGNQAAAELERLWRDLPRFPFFEELTAMCAARGTPLSELRDRKDGGRLLRTLIDEPGLGLANLPKALVPFHRYREGSRTALEEHLREGAVYLADRHGRSRFHFTIAPEARARFAAEAAESRRRLHRDRDVFAEVEMSVQDPATDTLAATPEGEPFRLDDGTLLLRPGGHGALLGNLGNLDARWVLIKNIDNVAPEALHATVGLWQGVLGGLLVELTTRAHELVRRLDSDAGAADGVAAAAAFLAGDLGVAAARGWAEREPAEARRLLRERLDRPLRVCGVVANTGEPGGGPFWVQREGGEESLQIVEKAELAPGDEGQAAVFASSTHFNPVQIAAGLRDAAGRPYDLDRYTDPRAVFVARKTHAGRDLLALERPGLWNGAMAAWNTVFVEIPGEIFTPVKTVFDLLRPEHQL
jgi:hypothetical protein